MRTRTVSFGVLAAAIICGTQALAGNESRAGRLVKERPTLKCLGVRWYVSGDANKNAKVELRYRKAGDEAAEWKRGLDLFRTGPKWRPLSKPAGGEALFAGSIFYLDEGTEYEIKLNLVDPDGGDVEKLLKMKTRAEPKFENPLRTLHVVPGSGGGSGTADAPFKGLDAAGAASKPGDLILVHKGVYPATWTIRKNGEPGKPIVWRGAGDGEAIIDGSHHAKPPERGVSMSGIHDVWLEGLTVRNAKWGIVNHEGQRTVIRGCKTYRTDYGFTATRHSRAKPCLDLFFADNHMTGPSTWPRTKGIEGARGVQMSGMGHVVCHSFFHGFADAVDTFGSEECSSIDIYRNEIEVMTDDAIECDYSQHNVRCFENRCTNIFQGITTQPTFAGPIYIFRNVMYNVGMETFKMHNGTTGCLFFHNTSVKKGYPLVMYSGAAVQNTVYRNNIFIGTSGNYYCYENTAPLVNCDFDYDGYSSGQYRTFMKLNRKRYATPDEVRNGGEYYKHLVMLDAEKVFKAGDIRPKDQKTQYKIGEQDPRLAPGSKAIDAGARLFNINDDFKGEAPDLGAYELGARIPHYGPRPKGYTERKETDKPKAPAVAPKAEAGAAARTDGPTAEERSAAGKRFAELKKAIIDGAAAGRRARVYVEIAGRPARARILAADADTLEVFAGGLEVKMKWSALSAKRFYGIARKYSRDRRALYEYCLGSGLVEEAEKERPRE